MALMAPVSPSLGSAEVGTFSQHPLWSGTEHLHRKSEVAVELAHEVHERSPDLSIFWLNGSRKELLVSSLRVIGNLANVVPCEASKEDYITQVASWLDSGSSGSWLMIVDNIDIATTTAEFLREILPSNPSGCIVFTTRNRKFALDLVHPTHLVEVPPMNTVDACDLFLSYTGPGLGNQEEATTIVSKLDCLPVAIVCSGNYIRSTSSSLQDFLTLVECESNILPVTMSGSRAPVLSSTGLYKATPLHPVIDIEVMTMQNMSLQRIIFVIACLHNSAIPADILSKLADTSELKEALLLLRGYYVIRPVASSTAWQMNSFARAITRGHLTGDPLRVDHVVSALQLVARIFLSTPDPHPKTGYACDGHAVSVIRTIIQLVSVHDLPPSSLLLMVSLGMQLCQYLVGHGRAGEASDLIASVLKWATSISRFGSSALDPLRGKFGALQHNVGRFEAAELVTTEVLRSQIYTIGEKHADTLHSLNNLGVIYQDQGHYQKAENYLTKALEMKERVFGKQHPETLVTINNLALSLQSQNKHRDAEELFCKALRGRRRLLPADHFDVLVSMGNLGVSYRLQGRIDQSMKMHQSALTGWEQMYGFQHPETLKSKGNLALLRNDLGQHAEATHLLRELAQAYKETQGQTHPDTIKTLQNLASLLYQQERYREAELVMSELLAILEEKHGKGSTQTFDALQYLATLFHLQHKYEEALEIVTWLFEARSETLGSEHSATICSAKHMKELEEDMRKYGRVDSCVCVVTIVS